MNVFIKMGVILNISSDTEITNVVETEDQNRYQLVNLI